MGTYVITFANEKEQNPENYYQGPLYSKVWEKLEREYGNPRIADNNGSCFRGKLGETAVLTDKGLMDPNHELVLINIPTKLISELEELIAKNK